MQTQKAWNIEYQNGKKSTFKTPSLDESIAEWRANTKEIDVLPRGEVIEGEEVVAPVTPTPGPIEDEGEDIIDGDGEVDDEI